LADMEVAGATVGTQESYTLSLDGVSYLKIWGLADGAGSIQSTGTVRMYKPLEQYGYIDDNGYYLAGRKGHANTATLEYIGTADGCSAVLYYASDTAPSYTPTSTAFCL